MKIRLRLRTIFVSINVLILLLPIGGIALFRMYENMLIWKTEDSLIHQAAFVKAIYTQRLKSQYPQLNINSYGRAMPPQSFDPAWGPWRPFETVLDLSTSEILPPTVGSKKTKTPADDIARTIGSTIQTIIRDAQVTTLSGITVTDINGVVVAQTNSILGRSLAHMREVKSALSGKALHVIRKRAQTSISNSLLQPLSRASEIKINIAHPIIIDKRIVGSVLLIRTPPDVATSLNRDFRQFGHVFFMIFILVIALSIFLAYAITRPIQSLVSQAKKASSGKSFRFRSLENPITLEVEELSRALTAMVDKQNKRAKYIKDFASHVSHEFKTPITSIEGAVELIQDHQDDISKEKQLRFLSNIASDTKRMKALINKLNELAKADAIEVSNQRCFLGPTLRLLSERYRSQFEAIEINLETNAHKSSDFTIQMSAEVLEGILNNLFDNSSKHHATIIKIRAVQNNGVVNLFFSDNGDGISTNNAKKIFEPFFTTNRKTGGTGLGLSITRSLLHSHKGEIEFVPSELGCQFELTFRVSD